ncbi:MAG: hypothetical protein PHW82_13905 [Bacteroidales bacterium]|nr:hypothetical protein [Bacteroidales bacterium]
MQRFFVIVIILLSINTLYAQIVSNDYLDSIIINTPQKENVLKYYNNIHKAERFIIKEKFDKASEAYFEAFKYIENPFEIDLLHALGCEQLRQNPQKSNVKFLVKKLYNKTGEMPIMFTDEPYNEVVKIDELEKFLVNQQHIRDSNFIKQLEVLLNIDQNIRNKSQTEHNGYAYNEYYKDTIQYLDSINYYKIIELINESEYISEELIGGGKNLSKIILIIIHNYQRTEILPILHTSVIAGTFDARIFAVILDICNYKFDNAFNISESVWFINEGIFLSKKYNKKKLYQLNKYRKCIYLDSFNNFQDKIKWSIKNPQYFFNFSPLNNQMYYTDEEFYPMILDYKSKKKSKTFLFFKSDEQEKRIISEAKEWELQNKK